MNHSAFNSHRLYSHNKVRQSGETGEIKDDFLPPISNYRGEPNTSGDKNQIDPSKANILIVDNRSDDLNLLTEILSAVKGYQIQAVLSGQLALTAAKSTPPDLILLDILMPEMNGYELCKELKASPETKDIPIIFISASHDIFDKVNAFAVGGVDYITKPFYVEEVLVRVENQLRLGSFSKQLREQNLRLQEEIEKRKQAQQKLKESDRHYRELFEASVDGIAIADIDGRFIDCNPSYQKMLGYSLEEIKQKSFWEITPAKWHQWEAEIIDKQIIQRGYSDTFKKEYIRKDGTVFPIELTVYCRKNESGVAELTWAVVRDISDRQQIEEALKKSERKYRNLVETSQDMIWSVDTQGRFTFVNQAVKQIYGYEPEEMMGCSFIDFVLPEQVDKDAAVFQRLLQGESIRQYETIHLAKDHQPIYFLFNAIPLLDEQGKIVGTTGTASDITERKLAQAEIIRSKDLLESVFNESPDAIFLVNPETGLTTDCNRRAVELFEDSSKEQLLNIEGHTLQKEAFTPEQLESIFEQVERYGFWSQELQYVTKKGKVFWGNIAAKPIPVAGQKMNLVRITDISDRKQAEESLRQSETREREKAQQLELAMEELKLTQTQLIQTEKMSSLGRMIAGVAHEINNPVSFIWGNLTPARQYFQDLLQLVELYQETYPNPTLEIQDLTESIGLDFLVEDWSKLMDSMQVGTERIYQIVLSLKSFSRQNESELKPVDIHEGIDNTLLILQHRLKAVGDRPAIQVIKEYGQLPKVTCYASQLNQVFMNLLSNAIDALETKISPRLITIRTSIQNSKFKIHNKIPQFLVIRIADNGSGIDKDVQQKIFDPFFTTKPVGSGTGLGLSISYQIVVQKHKGQISCISAPGQGTEFIVEIPLN